MNRLALALVLLSTAATASADVSPEDAARATKLFEEGRRLADSGNPTGACANFEASFQLDPQVGTRLNLADCREQQGRFLEAYQLFDAALAEASSSGKEGRATFARQRRDALAAKLVRVSLHVPTPPPPGLALALHGREVPAAQWATMQLADPGTIAVDASAPGKKPAHVQRTATAGEQITLDIPALEPDAAALAEHDGAPAASHLPLVVTVAGGALLAGSVAIGLHARSRWSTATSAGSMSGVTSAQHEADVATGVAVLGAAAAAVGVYLYLHAPHGTLVTPTTDGSSVGLAISGTL